MTFRTLHLLICVCCLGAFGCSDASSPESGSTTSTDGAGTTSPVTPPAGVGDELAPDGNNEPPLPDVTNAVDSLPSADAANITLRAVTPDEFKAAPRRACWKVVFVDFWATW